MNVFELDQSLLSDYERFARSFTNIRAGDIRKQVDGIYSSGRYWPDPLVTVNPHFEPGRDVNQLVSEGLLHPHTASVFRVGGAPIRLHKHQDQAVTKAKVGKSFVVTTGTGSGKSLCFFIPIIDAAIRGRLAGEPRRTRAIIVYPMNALANSQLGEINKFVIQSGLPEHLQPTFARYTGQESTEERAAIRDLKPDVILTNFMMLELLMTRQKSDDKAVLASAEGLDFIVLDELHTYRGRQGADVAMLMRRVRDRLSPGSPLQCIGTSATMVSEGTSSDRSETVSRVASRLFGTDIGPDAIIEESLERATLKEMKADNLGSALQRAIDEDIPELMTDAELSAHPLAVWIELSIGLEDGLKLARKKPISLERAADILAEDSARPRHRCLVQLQKMLSIMACPAKERGGIGDRAFLAFKLHRFISGAGEAHATLKAPGDRNVTVDAQAFDPSDPSARLYSTYFCRECGQEYHPVTLTDEAGSRVALPRSLDEVLLDDHDSGNEAGYLMLEPTWDDQFRFGYKPEDYPEDWQEVSPKGAIRLKATKRDAEIRSVIVAPNGVIGAEGLPAAFLPGKLRLCPTCGHQPTERREFNKIASLSAEGRSSATTLLVSSVLRWMNRSGTTIHEDKRKLLAFTDNRQDAALQAGHFNDFLFVSLLRGATLAAVAAAGPDGLSQDVFGARVQDMLGFRPSNPDQRAEWMAEPDAKGGSATDAERALGRVLTYRVWCDLRRGWRYTNPNLTDLGLIATVFPDIAGAAADETEYVDAPQVLKDLPPSEREALLTTLCKFLLEGLCISADVLQATELDILMSQARDRLRDPWGLGRAENARFAGALVVEAPRKADTRLQDERMILRAGPQSALGRAINRPRFWGGKRLKADAYREVLQALLQAARAYGIVKSVSTALDVSGWQLSENAIRLVPASGEDGRKKNPFYSDLYRTIANSLTNKQSTYFGLEGREHTAQVDQERREWREWRFRWEQPDKDSVQRERNKLREVGEPTVFLPALFCSPTMELGVDISALNVVYMRNVPPTPANYAQRSGRAGRSGQAALVVTYCSAGGPHDQYYFSDPAKMVSGVVRAPTLDLANRDLVTSHLQAVWMAAVECAIDPAIPKVLDLHKPRLPLDEGILAVIEEPARQPNARAAMQRLAESVRGELEAANAAWAADLDQFVADVADGASKAFSKAFDRWRDLYFSAKAQLESAHRRSDMVGLSRGEREEARSDYNSAVRQIAILETGGTGGSSDFYSYRYLATEGFLPGYNFPRLPLYAFVPGQGSSGAAMLQRARFLAISEFGPGSLIYHEGRGYHVHKAKLSASNRAEDGGKLATSELYICETCGAAHEKEVDLCHVCGAAMAGIHPIRNLLRIENVETKPAEQITANDEERQRRGFDIQTVFSARKGTSATVFQAFEARDDDGPVLNVKYAQSALISRINKGLRRRAKETQPGFSLDPTTGRWVASKGDDDLDENPTRASTQRVVPIVQDVKNTALISLGSSELSDSGMATLQHALTRGMEIVFQLEEGEILTEPTPSRGNRKAILAYEATEGGAGVLGRFAAEPNAVADVARVALGLMHFGNLEEAIAAADPTLLENDEAALCVKGCYRCLLSYYNQTDHQIIDRRDQAFLAEMLRMARSTVAPIIQAAPTDDVWLQTFERWQLPPADTKKLVLEGETVPHVWTSALVAAVSTETAEIVKERLLGRGFEIAILTNPADAELRDRLCFLLGGKK